MHLRKVEVNLTCLLRTREERRKERLRLRAAKTREHDFSVAFVVVA